MKKQTILLQILILAISVGCLSNTKSKVKFNSTPALLAEERIEFISENDTLVGYLSKPYHKKPYPVIVVLHSASHGHHDNKLYNHLEHNMNELGIGVFSFDRRGSGESSGNFNIASLETLAKDALNAIAQLKKRNDVNKEKIGLFGISQGGWLAPLAYSIDRSNISFLILLSSSGVSPARQMEYSAITTLKMNGYSDSIISTAKHLRNITNDFYRGHRERGVTQREIDKYRQEPWFPDVYLPWSGNLPEDIGVTKWIHEMDFNPEKVFEYVDIPIILFYGQTDRWVPIEASIKVWKRVFRKNRNTSYEIHSVNKIGHMMIIDEDNNPEQEIISGVYTRLLKEWAAKHIK